MSILSILNSEQSDLLLMENTFRAVKALENTKDVP